MSRVSPQPAGRPAPSEQMAGSVRIASGLNILAGLWLILAPFLLGYSDLERATPNNIAVGALILIMAGTRVVNPSMAPGLSWINAILGVWLILSPFVLGHNDVERAMWNDLAVGILVACLGAWSALSTPREYRENAVSP